MAEPEPTAYDVASFGKQIQAVVEELYPICRSITGDGVRRTLDILRRIVPLEVHEVPSGTPVLDWVVPREWNIRDAWIKDASGRRVVDFQRSNLHVVSYSTPVRRRMSRAELDPHLFSLPDRPDWIPYRTSYYAECWGFCLAHRERLALDDPEYEVCIDSTLAPGHLTYGELYLPGRLADEVLISTHICHPSLCNDNLAAVAISSFLARQLRGRSNRYSYRFLYIPGTIGSITWLARNREGARRVKHGLTLVRLGHGSPFTYKRSLRGTAEIDRVVEHVLGRSGDDHEVIDFYPYGYDERQFNSPGFRLDVGSLMRGRHGSFPEYHTSADDLSLISPEALAGSYAVCSEILSVLDANRRYRNLSPDGEPQLSRRGLYRAMGGESDPEELQLAMLWILSLCDGSQTLLDVVERSGLGFERIRGATELLAQHELLGEVP